MAKYTLSSSRVSRLVRALVALLVVSTAVGPVPLAAASKVSPTTMDTPVVESTPPPPARVVTVNRTAPKVSPVPTTLTFSSRPTEAELSRARVFAEPLLPIGATNAAENRALATALVAFVGSEPRDRTTWPLARFLADHPRSAWRLSLFAIWDRPRQSLRDDQSLCCVGRGVAGSARAGGRSRGGNRRSSCGRVARPEDTARPRRPGRGPAGGTWHSADCRARSRARAPGPGARRRNAYRSRIGRRPWPIRDRGGRGAHSRGSRGVRPRLDIQGAPSLARGTTNPSSAWRLPLTAIRHVAGAPLPTPAVVQWRAGHVGAVVTTEGVAFSFVMPAPGRPVDGPPNA